MKSMLTLAAFALCLSPACATDPNKDVRAVDSAHSKEVRENKDDNADLEAAQEKDHGALNSEHTKQDASMNKKVADTAAKYDKDRGGAEANLVEARRAFRAEAVARLEHVDTIATALESKHKKLNTARLASVRTNAAAVKSSVVDLDVVTDSNWFAAKKGIDERLATLEKDLHEIEGS